MRYGIGERVAFNATFMGLPVDRGTIIEVVRCEGSGREAYRIRVDGIGRVFLMGETVVWRADE